MDAVVAELLKQGPTEAELQRARSRILADFVRGAERLGGFGGRSDVLAESMTFDGRPDGYLDRLERIATATAAEVRATGAEVARRAALHAAGLAVSRRCSPGSRASIAASCRRSATPPDVTFPKVQRATLSNGLKVMLLERHSSAARQRGAGGRCGLRGRLRRRRPAPRRWRSTCSTTARRRATRSAIADELDAIGARISTGSSLDLSFVRLQALSSTLAPVARHLRGRGAAPVVPAGRWWIWRRSGGWRRSARRRRRPCRPPRA